MVKTILFLVLSAADFVLTSWLLREHAEWVTESNPVAAWCLNTFGLLGLATFKLITVLCLIFICQRLAAHKPHYSRHIFSFACLLLIMVVSYSCFLMVYLHQFKRVYSPLEEKGGELTAKLDESQIHRDLMHRLQLGLAQGDFSLQQAVSQSFQSPKTRDPRWIAILKKHYGTISPEQTMAAKLVHLALLEAYSSSNHDSLGHILDQYRSQFGPGPLPRPIAVYLGDADAPPAVANFDAAGSLHGIKKDYD